MPVAVEPVMLLRSNADSNSGRSENESSSSAKRKMSYYSKSRSSSSCSLPIAILVILTILFCDLSSPVSPVPLPSSSAWSLPTLNYLFKDTKTRSQSLQYQKDSQGRYNQKAVIPSSSSSSKDDNDNKVSSTGRLISAHDIRLTDNWGWVRRGVSDPAQTTEQRRRNNIRHSKSKHKQRHYSSSPSFPSSSGKGKKKEKMENLLCPFDEIRGPDGKCRKAPRFSLYRVGRK